MKVVIACLLFALVGSLAAETNAPAAVAFPESHTVAVAATPKALDACAKIVADVDRKPNAER